MSSDDNISFGKGVFTNFLLNVVGDTIGIVLFAQVLFRAVCMSVCSDGTLPPVRPPPPKLAGTAVAVEDKPTTFLKQPQSMSSRHELVNISNDSEVKDTYLSRLSRIGNVAAAAAAASPCKDDCEIELSQRSCNWQCSAGDAPTGSLYYRIVPFLSMWLLGLQAALGLGVYVYRVSHYANPAQNCERLGVVSLAGFIIGHYILLVAMAIQSHIINNRCKNIFYLAFLAGAAHFILGGLLLAKPHFIISAADGRCMFKLSKAKYNESWVQNIPQYIAIPNAIFCMFLGASAVNGTRRLIVGRPRRIITAWLLIILQFQGAGSMLLTAAFGLLWWISSIAVASTGHFDFFPMWSLLWPIMSRLIVAVLWRRAYVDLADPLLASVTSTKHGMTIYHCLSSLSSSCHVPKDAAVTSHLLKRSRSHMSACAYTCAGSNIPHSQLQSSKDMKPTSNDATANESHLYSEHVQPPSFADPSSRQVKQPSKSRYTSNMTSAPAYNKSKYSRIMSNSNEQDIDYNENSNPSEAVLRQSSTSRPHYGGSNDYPYSPSLRAVDSIDRSKSTDQGRIAPERHMAAHALNFTP
ncbi:hypothetical protein EV182_002866, partial [Spiromyces aspiralis]